MKKISAVTLSLLFFLTPIAISCASKSPEKNQPSKATLEKKAKDETAAYTEFKSSDGWNKLDGRFKQAWNEAITKGDLRKSFECLIKTVKKPSDEEKRMLLDAGYEYRSAIGRILSGSVIAKDVPNVASLPFVQVMELAVPMTLKKP